MGRTDQGIDYAGAVLRKYPDAYAKSLGTFGWVICDAGQWGSPEISSPPMDDRDLAWRDAYERHIRVDPTRRSQ